MKTRFLAALVVGSGSLCLAADPMPRSSPESQGVSSSAILAFVEAADKNIDSMNSFMLVRHGQVVAEGWWAPYDADAPHSLYSLSKSFTSTAVGLAIAEGKLSVDDEVLKFFPEDAPDRTEQEPQGDAGQRPAAHVHGPSGRAETHAGDSPGPRPSWHSPCRTSRAPISSTTHRRRTCSRPSSRRRRA